MLSSCSKRSYKYDVRGIDSAGKISKLHRRVPEYNKSVLEKIGPSENISHTAENIKSDGFGDNYYSTGKGERDPIRGDFSDIETVTTIEESSKKGRSNLSKKSDDNSNMKSNPFVPLNDINFNESKNIKRGQELLLNEQNITHTPNKYRDIDTIKIHPNNSIDDNQKNYKLPTPKRKEIVSSSLKDKRNLDTTGFLNIGEIGNGYFIQAGVYRNRNSIDVVLKKITSITTVAAHMVYDDTKNYYKIMLGPFATRKDADEVISQLVDNGYYDVMLVQKWR